METELKGRDPEEIFRDIYVKCQKLGITSSQLIRLKSVQRLNAKRNKHSTFPLWTRCGAVAAVLLAAVLYFKLHTTEAFSRAWFYLEDIDIHGESCTIEMPSSVQNAFMPPVDCSLCKNLTHVEHVAGISPELFEKRYAYSGIPVVVTDAMSNWTAPEVFNFNFFKTIYSKDSPALMNFERDCQFFPYQTDFRNLGEVFEMNPDRAMMKDGNSPWYIGWSNCDLSVANVLRKHYQRPYFLPHNSESTKMDWIFMGSPGYGAHMHIDHVGNPSWQAQIRGRKLWTLEPVAECYRDCQTVEVVVEPGEIFILDTNRWYHKTLIVSEDMSITIGSEYD